MLDNSFLSRKLISIASNIYVTGVCSTEIDDLVGNINMGAYKLRYLNFLPGKTTFKS